MGRYKKGYLGPRIEEVRERCKTDLKYLCTELLGMKRWSGFHDDLVKFMNEPGRAKLILMPRGHQKTSLVTLAWSIQQILKDPNTTNIIVSATWNLSRAVLRDISNYLTTGSELPKYFGQFKTREVFWTREGLNIAQKKDMKNPSFLTAGVDTGKTGSHCRNLIFDDIVSPENITTKEQIQKVIEAYRDCLPLLDPGGKIIMIGTRYAIGDVYGHIMDNEMRSLNGHVFFDDEDRKNWRKYLWPVQEPNKFAPERPLGRFDVFLRQAIEHDAVIFPEAFVKTDKELDEVLKKDPDAAIESLETVRRVNAPWKWSGQYMNDPVDQDAVEFKTSWFSPITETQKGQFTKAKTILSLDPAFRLKQHNDYNGLVLTKVLPNNEVCVLYAEQLKLNPDKLVFEIFRLYERYRFDLLVLETAQAQILMVNLLREEMKRRNLYFVIDEINPGNTDSKAARIRGLIPHYANLRIFHAPGLSDLENQLTEFPRNNHDDIIDALAYQIPHWTGYGEGHKPKPQIKEGSWDWWKKDTEARFRPRLRVLFSDMRRGR